eukprot:GHVR01058772.1.p1 GENE.GHVR01058772.1~~GHVR01058772.1.p1  ORF type:complete len:246 (+),score=26.25 GHVR01058772.1:57-794(+)
MDGLNSPEVWYKSLPVITKIMLTTIFIVTVMTRFGMFSPVVLILDMDLVIKKLHVWRLFTDYLFLGSFGFPWLVNMYLFSHFSTRLENNEIFQNRGGGDYLFFIVLQMLLISALSFILNYPTGAPMNAPSLIFAIIYYWSKREPYGFVSYYGFNIQSFQLPFALMFLNVLLGASIWTDLMGLLSAHAYFFVREVVPVEYNYDVIKCPYFIHYIVNYVASQTQPGGATTRGPVPPRNNWGGGQRLG